MPRRAATLAALLLAVAACGSPGGSGWTGSPSVAVSRPTPAGASAPPETALPTEVGARASAPVTGVLEVVEYPVAAGSHPHDVAPAADGGVWFTAQRTGQLGHLDPGSGQVDLVDLGRGSSPHGVIVGPDDAAWVTDGGLNAIVRVDAGDQRVDVFRLPAHAAGANLNTATFDGDGTLWFTGQAGFVGRLNPGSGLVEAFPAPKGTGPYGIATTPDGEVWFVSLAGSYLGRIDRGTGDLTVIDPPTARQGARRVWSDPEGRLLISEYAAGQVGRYDPATQAWEEWPIPGDRPAQPYAIFVDEQGIAWLSDFGNDVLLRFDPASGEFTPIRLPTAGAAVRQLLGRPGEVWGAESATDRLVLIRTGG